MNKLYSEDDLIGLTDDRHQPHTFTYKIAKQLLDTMRENVMLKQLLDSHTLASDPIFNNKYTPPEGIAALVEQSSKHPLPDIARFGYAIIGQEETDRIAADVLNEAFAENPTQNTGNKP